MSVKIRWRPALVVLGAVFGIFVLANAAMFFIYWGKPLPNYSATPLPDKITLVKGNIKQVMAPSELGVKIDQEATKERLVSKRMLVPVLSFFTEHSVPPVTKLDEAKFAGASATLAQAFKKPALPERVVLNGENFEVAPPEAGFDLDVENLKKQLMQNSSRTSTNVPVKATGASEPAGQLGDDLEALNKKLGTKITLVVNGESRQLSRNEIGRFFEPSGQTMQLSAPKIGEVVGQIGPGTVNQNEAVQAALYALSKSRPVTFVLAGQGAKVYRYCVSARGLSASVLEEYKQKLAATYGDPNGWNRGGIALVYAESGCDFTAWLSAPGSMTSFGGVCDSYYSCRIGRNVVVNYDRWMGATDPWNAAGGSLEDYRVMVINHETGHWLGFGHRNCSGAGQPAPVMQQQSIDLQGCKFNPWPTEAEIAAL
jgi:hypothetical protein